MYFSIAEPDLQHGNISSGAEDQQLPLILLYEPFGIVPDGVVQTVHRNIVV